MTKINTYNYQQRLGYHHQQLQTLASHLLSNGQRLEPPAEIWVNNIPALMSIDNELETLRDLLDSYRTILAEYERDCNTFTGRVNIEINSGLSIDETL